MRARLALVTVLAACRPTATVERTMPVANLQTYRTLGVRVRAASPNTSTLVPYLEAAIYDHLRRQCGFERVARAGAKGSDDVVLDVNITAAIRGGGVISNPNQSTVDTLLVLSEGHDGELLGTARIRGKSSGIVMNGASPEGESLEVISKSAVDLLATSGCAGPRVARAETPPPAPPPPPPPSDHGGSAAPSPPPPPVDESKRPEAEALNEDGKEKLRAADLPGALAAFQQASALVPDARYEFNACLALEAQEQWDSALAACRRARALHPLPELIVKIDKRIDLIQHRQ